jgi:hypothetical protein
MQRFIPNHMVFPPYVRKFEDFAPVQRVLRRWEGHRRVLQVPAEEAPWRRFLQVDPLHEIQTAKSSLCWSMIQEGSEFGFRSCCRIFTVVCVQHTHCVVRDPVIVPIASVVPSAETEDRMRPVLIPQQHFVVLALVHLGLVPVCSVPILEEDLVVANPTDDHVGSWHLPIRREAEPDISQRTHLNFKCDIFCAGSPEDCVVGIEIY